MKNFRRIVKNRGTTNQFAKISYNKNKYAADAPAVATQ